jgi:FKBP-type peptidyl-prolyl cis-trans isomerase 2
MQAPTSESRPTLLADTVRSLLVTTATHGDTVKVHYTGKLDDGTVFDSSVGREPLEFTIGAQSVIRGFEAAVEGMAVGSATTVVIGPEDAYGPRVDDKITTIERSQLPDDPDPEIGMVLQAQAPEGMVLFTITEVSDETVTLDANHPLAGKQLTFDIEVTEIAKL